MSRPRKYERMRARRGFQVRYEGRAWHLTLKEGGLINGIVTDEEKLKSQLKRFWMENGIPRKNVRLVLESSRLISRQVELPKMKKKQLR